MAKEIYIDAEDLTKGLYALEDTTKAPFGTARIMRNVQITDRGGIAPRTGVRVIGDFSSVNAKVKGLYNYRTSFEQDEILVKAVNGELQFLPKQAASEIWSKIKTGYDVRGEFGFLHVLVNEDDKDYLVFCNRYNPYSSWEGAYSDLTATLSGGETAIPVTSTLLEEDYDGGDIATNTTTTIQKTDADWADDQWNGLYVLIVGGTYDGYIRKISDTTSDTLTFAALPGAPGNVEFQIRALRFPETGTLSYNGSTVAYTAIPTSTTLTVASAHAGTSGQLVTVVPIEYPGAPRGNRMDNYLGRVVVGRVRSARARNTGGALQGYRSGGSAFVSKQLNPLSFDYSATRVAGEGDIIGMPYGGGEISDVIAQEDQVYVFKPRYTEAISYSQDDNDVALRDPLKPGVGAVGKAIRGADDVYFFTPDKKFTSIGRVSTKDVKPQTDNIGVNIKRLLDTMDPTEARGIEYKDKIYTSLKSSPSNTDNDITLVYNRNNRAYEGLWNIGASDFAEWNDLLVFADASGPNVFKFSDDYSDVINGTRFPISTEYASHFFNLTPSKADMQSLSALFFEGYLIGESELTFRAWKEFEEDPFFSLLFSGADEAFFDGSPVGGFLGNAPYGFMPIGDIDQPDDDGLRHFQFIVYFPFQYANYFSVGWDSSENDNYYEITRYALGITEDISRKAGRIKSS